MAKAACWRNLSSLARNSSRLPLGGDEEGEAAAASSGEKPAFGQVGNLRILEKVLQGVVGGLGVEDAAQLPVAVG